MKNLFFPVFLILCGTFGSCKKNGVAPPVNHKINQPTAFYPDTLIRNGGGPEGVGVPYAAEYFPNTPGDEWTYQVTDSLQHNKQYLVTINVLSSKTSSKIWVITLPDETDTLHVIAHDSVIDFLPVFKLYHSNPPFLSLGMRLMPPFYRGLQWQYNPYPTKGKVIGLDTLTQNDFGYPGKIQAFRLYLFLGGGGEYWGVFTVVFAPNIGIISIDRYVFNAMPTAREHWQLIHYQLQGPPLYNP